MVEKERAPRRPFLKVVVHAGARTGCLCIRLVKTAHAGDPNVAGT